MNTLPYSISHLNKNIEKLFEGLCYNGDDRRLLPGFPGQLFLGFGLFILSKTYNCCQKLKIIGKLPVKKRQYYLFYRNTKIFLKHQHLD